MACGSAKCCRSLAKQADKYSIIRSMTHGNNGHETAAYIVQTGRQPDRLSWPGLGAIVSKFKGYDHGYKGLIPPYVVLTTTQGRFSECGFLGPKYKPFATGGDPAKPRFEVEGVIAAGISDERQKRRRDLLHRIDTLGRAMPAELQFPRSRPVRGTGLRTDPRRLARRSSTSPRKRTNCATATAATPSASPA